MELYITSLSNLTDARFFGAYGVPYFGFSFDVLDPNAVTIDKAREIAGWLHEPHIIGQFGKHQSAEEIAFVHTQLPLYAVQLDADHPERDQIGLPVWLKTPESILDISENGLFLLGDWTPASLAAALEVRPYGIAIPASKEERPGISRVEAYAELMEVLEPHLS